MKISTTFIALLYVIMMAACSAKEDASMEEVVKFESDSELTKKLVENGEYIDLDVKALAFEVANGGTTQSTPEELKKNVAMMKAAIHRFYSKVEIIDGHYVVRAESGKELNVSERVYEALSDNLNEMNTFIDNVKAKGEEIKIPEITSDYLNSLLE
ncbi:MAG: hypothetical protein K1W02_00080 [Muribaculaceae bacterium]|jgi:hypothetical protein